MIRFFGGNLYQTSMLPYIFEDCDCDTFTFIQILQIYLLHLTIYCDFDNVSAFKL